MKIVRMKSRKNCPLRFVKSSKSCGRLFEQRLEKKGKYGRKGAAGAIFEQNDCAFAQKWGGRFG